MSKATAASCKDQAFIDCYINDLRKAGLK
jgi:hypothetical protein